MKLFKTFIYNKMKQNYQELLTGKNGKQIIGYFKSRREELDKITNFLPNETSISERAYCVMNNITNVQLCICSKPLAFHKFNKGYFKTCGREICVKIARTNAINNTMISTYGCHTSLLDSTKQKSKDTLLIRYNNEKYVNTESRAKTMLEKYGVKHALQSQFFQDKKEDTQLEKYGKRKYNNIEKIQNTNIQKYNVKNVSSVPEIRNKTRDTFNMNHLLKLNDKILKLNLVVNSSIDNHYHYQCTKCGALYKMSNSAFNVHIRSNESPCNICNPPKHDFKSKGETELKDFIVSVYNGSVVQNYLRGSSKELDIFIPDKNLAFEYNGLYYHNELFKENNYHLSKKNAAKNNNINLVHVFEDEWLYKKEIVKSRIKGLLGVIDKKIYARKCVLRLVQLDEARRFIDENHLQGYVGSKIKIGLYYKDELVSIMTFGAPRFDKKPDTYEMLRFCSKLNTIVIGGASKMFQYLINNYKINRVITESNRSWSVNDISTYDKIGFKFLYNSVPGFWYVIRNTRVHRLNYCLHQLKKRGLVLENETSHDAMLRQKIYRIYDCGNAKYEWLRT